MANENIFEVIGDSLENLTESIGVIAALSKHDDRASAQVKLFSELHDRISMEERMLRTRFELPKPRRKSSVRELSDIIGHRMSAAERPQEIYKRLRTSQELSRLLEEYFRFFNLEQVSLFFRKLRFDLYGFERVLVEVLGPVSTPQEDVLQAKVESSSSAQRLVQAFSECPYYFILDESLTKRRDPLRVGYDAIKGGVKVLQLRFKDMSTRDQIDLARKLKPLCMEQNSILIINDRLDVALLSGADGIHVGERDVRVQDIRQISNDLLIGVTARNPADALQAQSTGADYIGSGTVFGSKTKPNLPVIGTRGLTRIVQAVDLPVVAIGGITVDNCAKVILAGAQGFCSIKPFTAKRSVKNLAQEFKKVSLDALHDREASKSSGRTR